MPLDKNISVSPYTSDLLNSLRNRTSKIGYLQSYLQEQSVKTVIVENEYIDRDYVIDYSMFYSRSFQKYGNRTKRLHFFKNHFDFNSIKDKIINQIDENFVTELKNNYIGFIVVKPAPFKRAIGRTLLVPYQEYDNENNHRFFPCKVSNKANLLGIDFPIQTIRYQEQDTGVCACATIAIWVALHKLNDLFNINSQLSPAEITQIANESFPGIGRTFPSGGLNYFQISGLLKYHGLDTEYLEIDSVHNDTELILSYIYGYLKFGIPLIAGLRLVKPDDRYDLHSVVITGYKIKNAPTENNEANKIMELYIHDDGIGPFSKLTFTNNNPTTWSNEWLNRGYIKVELESIIVPIYNKIRLSVLDLINALRDTRLFNDAISSSQTHEIFLTTISNYKKEIFNYIFSERENFLGKSMPRFIWVVRLKSSDYEICDWLFDATEHFPQDPNSVEKIRYKIPT